MVPLDLKGRQGHLRVIPERKIGGSNCHLESRTTVRTLYARIPDTEDTIDYHGVDTATAAMMIFCVEMVNDVRSRETRLILVVVYGKTVMCRTGGKRRMYTRSGRTDMYNSV